MTPTILMIGALDTKAEEYEYLRGQLLRRGARVLVVNTGILGSTDRFAVDVESDELARAADTSLATLRGQGDRGAAMEAIGIGAGIVLRRLFDEQKFDGAIGMGGSGGTSVICTALRALPLGVPKVCVTTVAAADTTPYLGTKDIVLVPAITDVAGVNRISRLIMTRAAGAVVGMASAPLEPVAAERPIIAASMFGNTTQCVDLCRRQLEAAGYEVLVFHATGSGGRSMESLIDEGFIAACLDITTTELADELCGGIFSAGPDRLTAAGRRGIPHLVVPGCLDMVNFGAAETVPEQYRRDQRLLYAWNPAVTLMRTNRDENRALGRTIAARVNQARGPLAVLLPLRGLSILDGDGERFCDREADAALYDTLREQLRDDITVEEVDANINDPEFARRAVEMLLELIAAADRRRAT